MTWPPKSRTVVKPTITSSGRASRRGRRHPLGLGHGRAEARGADLAAQMRVQIDETGSSVTSPRSIARAPAGGAGGFTAVIRSPVMTTVAFRSIWPLTTSSIRAARTITTGAGACSAAMAVRQEHRHIEDGQRRPRHAMRTERGCGTVFTGRCYPNPVRTRPEDPIHARIRCRQLGSRQDRLARQCGAGGGARRGARGRTCVLDQSGRVGDIRIRRKPDGWRPRWALRAPCRSDIDGGAASRFESRRNPARWHVGRARGGGIAGARSPELPDAVSFAQGAALPTAGLAALRMLRLGPAILGRRVLITGASAAGLAGSRFQLAHLGGAEVTAPVSEGVRRGRRDFVNSVPTMSWQTLRSSVAGSTWFSLSRWEDATLGRLVTIVDPDGDARHVRQQL